MQNRKNRKIIVVLAIAVVCTVLAGALIFAFLSPQRTTVYVFKDNYEAGTIIESSMLTPVQADSKVIVAGGDADISSYFITSETFSSLVKTGDALKVNVEKGSPLLTSTLTSDANNNVEVRMEPTSVAVTIPVDNSTGVTADIKAESHVNVYATYNAGGTYLLLENVRILNVVSDGANVSGLTLEVNNANAVKLINAVNTGRVYCGLVNGSGYVYEAPAGN